MSVAVKKRTLRQGATSPPYYNQVTGSDGGPVNLAGATVTASMEPVAGGANVFTNRACTITDAALGKFLCPWLAADSVSVGEYRIEFTVLLASGEILIEPHDRDAEVEITAALGV